MNEEWKKIEGTNAEISSYGRVRENGKIKTLTQDPEGYLRCSIKGLGRERIHRLVAKYFVPNPNNYNCVDHIDQNKQNNNVENIRWVSRSENAKNAVYHSYPKDTIIGMCVVTGEIKEFKDKNEASYYIGIKTGSKSGEVTKVLTGKRKTTHGWTFWYKLQNPEFDFLNEEKK